MIAPVQIAAKREFRQWRQSDPLPRLLAAANAKELSGEPAEVGRHAATAAPAAQTGAVWLKPHTRYSTQMLNAHTYSTELLLETTDLVLLHTSLRGKRNKQM